MILAATKQLVSWLDELGAISEETHRLTRTGLSAAMRRANNRVAQWMRATGLAVREDAVGNVIGRLEADRPGAKTLLLGSHLDTVRDAGRFDGPLGVLLPIVVLADLKRRSIRLPFAVEVIGFCEEEGVRFGSAYLGSKGYTGQLRAHDFSLRDANGVSVREALASWSASMRTIHRATEERRPKNQFNRPPALLGYVEVHIEQGPVLEAENLAVGVVSAIAGQTRSRLTFRGRAGHAGTTPMKLRRDALAGAAEFMVFAETIARRTPGLVATVGMIEVVPGAANVIPGSARISLDVRHSANRIRRSTLARLKTEAARISRRRTLDCEWLTMQDDGAVGCSPELSRLLSASVRRVQKRSRSIVSGAGHDAVVVSAVSPVAMLFVRCRGGLSHHPDEYASPADLDVALRVMLDFVERLKARHEQAFAS